MKFNDGYYRLDQDDFNFCEPEKSLRECNNYDIHHCAECWEKVIRELEE